MMWLKKENNNVYEHAYIKGYFIYTGMYLQYLSINRKGSS